MLLGAKVGKKCGERSGTPGGPTKPRVEDPHCLGVRTEIRQEGRDKDKEVPQLVQSPILLPSEHQPVPIAALGSL